MTEYSEAIRSEAMRRRLEGYFNKEIARDLGISTRSIRRWALEEGLPAKGRNAHSKPREVPPPLTRRCANKQCINRFIPVNTQHRFCTDACGLSEETWSFEEILQEEGSLLPDAAPLEMAKRAFAQKNMALRRLSDSINLREYLRYEVRALHDEQPELRFPVVAPPQKQTTSKGERELIVQCSDWQVGKLENGIGVTEMVERRVPRIIEAVQSIATHFRDSGYAVNRIHVVFGGDMIEGCWIYGGQNITGLDRTSNTHRITRQIPLAATLEASLVRAIAQHTPEVIVHSVPGNHGRPNGRNEFADPEDNFDTMVADWAKDKLAGQTNVKWDICEQWWSRFDVLGHPVVAFHGDQWRGSLGEMEKLLPRWVMGDMFGVRPSLVLTHHRHDYATMRVNSVYIHQNGTIDGGSEWYTKKYGKSSAPTQTVIVMSERRGAEAFYPILVG
jgi:hypothetical protein